MKNFGRFLAALAILLAIASPLRAQAPGVNSLTPAILTGVTDGHYIGAVSTNATLVVANTAQQVHGFLGYNYVNTNATTYYLKLYDKATAPTCGTDKPFAVFAMLQNNQKTAFSLIPRQLTNGLGFCIVGGIADADTSNGATAISVDLIYK
jgi:hypothetical protein